MRDELRILVFAKAPVPGAAKTRLIPALGAAGAARLHAALVRHTLATVCARNTWPVELWRAPPAQERMKKNPDDFFLRCAREFPVTLRTQRGGDLGLRMHHALADALQRARAALVVGTDCPAFTLDDLREAARALRENDAVIGPAEDGGYWLVGLRAAARELFTDIAWGGGDVLARTRARLREHGLTWHELPTRWDVDRPEDLPRLRESLPLAFEPEFDTPGIQIDIARQ